MTLTINNKDVTITAIYPNDGPTGSLTFDTETDKSRTALFLEPISGDEATEEEIIAAIQVIL